jgi:hypothetical protein
MITGRSSPFFKPNFRITTNNGQVKEEGIKVRAKKITVMTGKCRAYE